MITDSFRSFTTMSSQLRKVCLIPARYDATRFPGKLMSNLQKTPDVLKTVIRATFENISAMGIFDQVAIVSNSRVIQEEIEKHGGNIIFIEKNYESGTDRISDALGSIDADVIVNVQGDEPFVKKQPLQELLEVFDSNQQDVLVVSLMRLMDNATDVASSDFVKVVCDKNDFALYFSRSPVPFVKKKEFTPEYYEHVGVYGFNRRALLMFPEMDPTPLERIESVECLRFLENGIPIKMIKTSEHILEIDTEQDLIHANRLIQEGKLFLA